MVQRPSPSPQAAVSESHFVRFSRRRCSRARCDSTSGEDCSCPPPPCIRRPHVNRWITFDSCWTHAPQHQTVKTLLMYDAQRTSVVWRQLWTQTSASRPSVHLIPPHVHPVPHRQSSPPLTPHPPPPLLYSGMCHLEPSSVFVGRAALLWRAAMLRHGVLLGQPGTYSSLLLSHRLLRPKLILICQGEWLPDPYFLGLLGNMDTSSGHTAEGDGSWRLVVYFLGSEYPCPPQFVWR